MKKKILIIDDEVTFAKVLKFNLVETGKYEVLVESRGKEGLETARKRRPDLIILDLIMPDISGEQVLSQLKNQSVTKDIPVIILSSKITEEEIKKENIRLPKCTLLAKPIDIDKFLSIVDKMIK